MNIGEGRKYKVKKEREANYKRLLNTENKLKVARVEVGEEGWAKWVMGIKVGTCDEHCILYVRDESLGSTPEINTTLYVK